jgi:V/A-type H+-transporting ATPase subunit C
VPESNKKRNFAFLIAKHRKDGCMPQQSVAYAVARIRALETKLLTVDRINRMVEADSPEDAYKQLAETNYGTAMAEYSDYNEYESLLAKEMAEVTKTIEEVTPQKEVTDLFLMKYDIHNIKVLLKARLLGIESENLLVEGGTIAIAKLKDGVLTGNYRDFPRWLKATMVELEEGLAVRVNPQTIEIALDLAMFHHIFFVLDAKKFPKIKQYFLRQTDYINLKTLLRIKKLQQDESFLEKVLLPYGTVALSFYKQAFNESHEQLLEKIQYSVFGEATAEGLKVYIETGNLTVLEKQTDNALLAYIQEESKNPFGLEAVVGYLLAKENEIKIIRLIMVSRINGLSVEKLRERLRDVYA